MPLIGLRKLKIVFDDHGFFGDSWSLFVSVHPRIQELEIEAHGAFEIGGFADCKEIPMMENITKFAFVDAMDFEKSIKAVADYPRRTFICRLMQRMPRLEFFVGSLPTWDGGWNPLLRELEGEKRHSLQSLALICPGLINTSLFLDISSIRRLDAVKKADLSLNLFLSSGLPRNFFFQEFGFRTRPLVDHLPHSVEVLTLHIPGERHWHWWPGGSPSKEFQSTNLLVASQGIFAGFESQHADLVPLLKHICIKYRQRPRWQHSWDKFLAYTADICRQVCIGFSAVEILPVDKEDDVEDSKKWMKLCMASSDE